MVIDSGDIGEISPLNPYTRFTNRKPLGQGGTAIVESAFDSKSGELVALKSIKPDISNKDAEKEIEQDAYLGMVFNNPHILKTLEVIYTADGLVLVQEHLDPKEWISLKETTLLHRSFTLEQVANILTQVVDAYRYTQNFDTDASDIQRFPAVTHEDISPGNIMYNSSTGEIKLLDFGLTRFASFPNTSETKGTIPYMAPERISKQYVPQEDSAVVYSLSILTTELLTGHRLMYSAKEPFSWGANRKDYPVVMKNRLMSELGAITDPADTEKLVQLLSKGLLQNPNDRYQTPEEFVEVLQSNANLDQRRNSSLSKVLQQRENSPRGTLEAMTKIVAPYSSIETKKHQ